MVYPSTGNVVYIFLVYKCDLFVLPPSFQGKDNVSFLRFVSNLRVVPLVHVVPLRWVKANTLAYLFRCSVLFCDSQIVPDTVSNCSCATVKESYLVSVSAITKTTQRSIF